MGLNATISMASEILNNVKNRYYFRFLNGPNSLNDRS